MARSITSETPEKRILIVEDQADTANLIQFYLNNSDYQSHIVTTGEEGLQLGCGQRYHLLILDLNLPDMDGLHVCQRLREAEVTIPIIIVSCRSSEQERVLGLEVGADDYLGKPFGVEELTAKVRALFRRIDNYVCYPANGQALCIGEITIQPLSRAVTLKNKHIELTAKEFDLLLHFVRSPGRVYSRAQLIDNIWGRSFDGYEHTVSSHINRLRAKIEDDPSVPKYITTVWGVGYKFDLQAYPS